MYDNEGRVGESEYEFDILEHEMKTDLDTLDF